MTFNVPAAPKRWNAEQNERLAHKLGYTSKVKVLTTGVKWRMTATGAARGARPPQTTTSSWGLRFGKIDKDGSGLTFSTHEVKAQHATALKYGWSWRDAGCWRTCLMSTKFVEKLSSYVSFCTPWGTLSYPITTEIQTRPAIVPDASFTRKKRMLIG